MLLGTISIQELVFGKTRFHSFLSWCCASTLTHSENLRWCTLELAVKPFLPFAVNHKAGTSRYIVVYRLITTLLVCLLVRLRQLAVLVAASSKQIPLSVISKIRPGCEILIHRAVFSLGEASLPPCPRSKPVFVLGSEIAGTVVNVGADVTASR